MLELENYKKTHELWLRIISATSEKGIKEHLLHFIGLEIPNAHPFITDEKKDDQKDTHSFFEIHVGIKVYGYLALEIPKLSEKQKHLCTLCAQSTGYALLAIDNMDKKAETFIESSQYLVDSVKIMNKELQAALDTRSTFLSQMSHEMRTPLNVILGMTDFLSSMQLDKEVSEKIAVIERSGSTLLHLVNNVLDLSKLNSGRIVSVDLEFDLVQLVGEVIAMLRGLLAEGRDLQINSEFADGFPAMRFGDPNLIRQILVNLVGNAVKFTPQGQITVKLEQTTTYCQISVYDTGIGINKHDKKSIFEEYMQAGSDENLRSQGTGLGLPICKKIATHFRGHIWVEDNLKDQCGSVFRVQLDLGILKDKKAAEKNEKKEENSFIDVDTRKVRVLFVDDTPDNILVAKLIFKKYPQIVTYCENGKKALEQFQQEKFDIIFMDLQMPIMDGIEAVNEIRQLEKSANQTRCHIVALTADVYKHPETELIKEGFNQKITKPFKKEDILRQISYVKETMKKAA